MNKNLSQKQLSKVAEWYGENVTDVRGYARFENGKLLDFILHFCDGSMAWLEASRGRGLYLAKVGF